MNSYHIITFGCQMNVHDSERIKAILEKMNLKEVSAPGDADIIILNTCSVRLKAEEKFYAALGRIKHLKKSGNPEIVVAGCTAQVAADEIRRRAPYVDLIIGTRAIENLPSLLDDAKGLKTAIIDTEMVPDIFETEDEYTELYSRPSNIKAYVTIMEGCNNFCSYCIVPFTRGREVYRPYDKILMEVSNLAKKGYLEIILLGQNVNAYRYKEIKFAKLLREVARVGGLKRVRFITSHPAYLDEETIEVMAEEESVCNQIHLPLQSGSNVILEAMNRQYTFEYYTDRVTMLKNSIKTLSISTDIIVGFPGERENDFQDTMRALKEIRYDHVYSFKYSIRPGTQSEKLVDEVHPDKRRKRLMLLQEFQKRITLENNEKEIGTVLDVLVDGFSKRTPKQLTGRSEANKVVNFTGPEHVMDKIVKVKINDATQNSLLGEYIG